MLHVLCRIGQDAYAIPCEAVEKVLPFAELKSLPGSVRGLAGLLNYQGLSVPIVDLCLLLADEPARPLLGTRILLCAVPEIAHGRLGLVVEGVSEVRRLPDEAFQSAGAASDPCLEGVTAATEGKLIQRIVVPEILPPDVLAGLELSLKN